MPETKQQFRVSDFQFKKYSTTFCRVGDTIARSQGQAFRHTPED
ncbi:hypothetical protein [Nostoc sp. CHAB 5836]|nr:hypothetical protein [Nostoc sp. CHAB 5836]